jgi:hypothetical protein
MRHQLKCRTRRNAELQVKFGGLFSLAWKGSEEIAVKLCNRFLIVGGILVGSYVLVLLGKS